MSLDMIALRLRSVVARTFYLGALAAFTHTRTAPAGTGHIEPPLPIDGIAPTATTPKSAIEPNSLSRRRSAIIVTGLLRLRDPTCASRPPPTIVRGHAKRRHRCPHERGRAREKIPVPHRTPSTAGSKRNVSSPPNQNTTQYRNRGSACCGTHAQSQVRMTAREIASTTPRRTLMCALTVKLSGRPRRPDKSRRRTLFPSARGAQPQARHGPLQRLLGGSRSIVATQ
jgi:hypothetical protein